MLKNVRRLARRLRGLGPLPSPAPPPARPPEPAPTPPPDPALAALAYHHRTQHHPGRFARALPYLDWDSQPDPFGRYEGAPHLPLARAPVEQSPRYEPAFRVGGLPARAMDGAAIGQLFQDALGLSAWKEAGDSRWALRVNPSSGNLHPTEGYLICGPLPGLSDAPAVYHYNSYLHSLARRAALPEAAWRALTQGLPQPCALIGLSDVTLRESWKYGERAYRYCQLDAGHAIACLSVAAAALGWDLRLLEGATDADLALLLGTASRSGPEAERAEALLVVFPAGAPVAPRALEAWRPAPDALQAAQAARWQGARAPLASDHHPWPILDAVALATEKASAPPPELWEQDRPENRALSVGDSPLLLRPLIHQRRSAVDLDGRTGITAGAFFQILTKLMPGAGQVPFQTLPWRAELHLLLFVHRVGGLPPGLYALPRAPDAEERLRAALDPAHAWSTPEGCPEGLPLRLLQVGDRRGDAAGVSCGQAIAGDGCFAVSMVAELEAALAARGAWFYRRLHWEAGAIGQMLYLEAEASGVAGTGIGCFFDGAALRAIGARGASLSPLYHFTVGGPVHDPRLRTLAPYGHLEEGGE